MRALKYIILFICSLLFVIPANVSANEMIHISVDYGVDGKVQIGKGFPMKITLENEGEHFTGDLVVFASPSYDISGNIVVPVELPEGETKTVELTVPGHEEHYYYNNQNNNQASIRLFEGEWQDGNEIQFTGDDDYHPSVLPENRLVIGALTNSFDSINFLNLVRYNNESIEISSINEADITNDSQALEVFDVLFIYDYNIGNMAVGKQQAIKEWVRSGGHLMIGSDTLTDQKLGELSELSQLTINGHTSFNELSLFTSSDQSDGENQPNFENVEIVTGDVNAESNVLYAEQSTPIVLNQQYGLGEVIQFTINVGAESLNSWEPYTSWWTEVLNKTVDKDTQRNQNYAMQDLSYRLGSVVESFPSSFIPVNILIILFMVYLVLIIPGLYFILKKLDKREIAWVVIPVVAIISSIAIFITGAKDRISGSQINQASILSIDESGLASGKGAFSILSSNGGDYEISIDSNRFAAFPRQNITPQEVMLDSAMVEKGQTQTTITYNDVEFWSIRSALGNIHSVETGRLITELQVEDQLLSGSITNNLQVDLEEAFLLTGSQVYPLGKIDINETIDVHQELNNSNIQNLLGVPRKSIASNVIQGYSSSYYGGQFGPQGKEDLTEWKKFELLDVAMNDEAQRSKWNQPIIAGYTTDSIIDMEANRNRVKTNALSLITQPVHIETGAIHGELSLSTDEFQKDINIKSDSQGFIMYNGLLNGEDFIDVEIGSYEISYSLPFQLDLENMLIDELRVSHAEGDGTLFYIYNVKTDEYEPFEDGKKSITIEDEAINYLAEDGSITIMFEKSNMNNPGIRIPSINVEGEYTND